MYINRLTNCLHFQLTFIKIKHITRGGSRISDEGVQMNKGGSLWYFYLNFHKNPHENEIILSKRGVRANPLNPL